MVPPDSGRVSRVRPYSGTSSGESSPFAYGAITRCGAAFQKLRLGSTFVTPAGIQVPGRGPTTPHAQRSGLGMHAVWAESRSLAATEDIDGSFSSWGY